MKINLESISYYYLTYNNPTRKEHIEKEFSDYNITEVNPIGDIGKNKSGTSGFCKILDLACINQDRNKPFQPFVIFEDDVKKYRPFPSTIDIPDDTDILYIGLSSWGMKDKNYGENHSVSFTNINKDIIRIYNMLSTHGMMICSIRGLLTMQKCMMEALTSNIIWDILTATIQPYVKVYALKNPLVYQYKKIGGMEKFTNIDYMYKSNRDFPESWKKKDFYSIMTFYV